MTKSLFLVESFLALATLLQVSQRSAFASGSTDGIVISCGDTSNVPVNLGYCKQVAAGYLHSAAIQSDGTVVAWGRNDNGCCNIPASLGPCLQVTAGGSWNRYFGSYSGFTCVLRSDGILIGYGTTPPALGVCTKITSSENHLLALQINGNVAAWGDNTQGQCNVPNDLGTATEIAAGGHSYYEDYCGGGQCRFWNYGHSLAIQSSGIVKGWGNNSSGQSYIPSNLGRCIKIAAGGWHNVAIRTDNTVKAWGENGSGQCNVPLDLGGCIDIAAGESGTVALQANGVARAWGSQCLITSECLYSKIDAGFHNTIGIHPFVDCNNNGVDDYLDIRDFGATNLDHDYVPDVCQGAVDYSVISPSLGVPKANTPVSFTFTNIVTPDNFSDVPLLIKAIGDFEGANEYLTVKLNDVFQQRVFQTNGVNCAASNGLSTEIIYIPYDTFANAVALGQLTVTLLPSPAVTVSECANGLMNVELTYLGIGIDGDCNSNGFLDTREIGENPSLDCNRNGQLDACEIIEHPLLDCNNNGQIDSCDIYLSGASDDDGNSRLDQCQYDKGDFDLDGFVDSNDLGILILYWMEIDPQFGDSNHDGTIDAADLGGLLIKFGPVIWE